MSENIQIQISPEQAVDLEWIEKTLAARLNRGLGSFKYRWKKRSIDARKRDIKVNATFEYIGLVPRHLNPRNKI